jgi:hypothetical protein
MVQGESTTSRLLLVLLDWEKAFDRITREGMFSALSRVNRPQSFIALIRMLYASPHFFVEVDGRPSLTHTQNTGIRQGCTLSPYMFIIVMTVLFADITARLTPNRFLHRATGATFDEVLFADDTILISQDTRTMNKFLSLVESEGSKYGLKLN